MKHFTLLALAALFAFSTQGQVIFESGFEDWTGGVPDGWDGAKTNITADPEQVTTNVHSGSSAVRLIKTETGHQRFTTQAVTVETGQTYTVNFWVRGEGQIRVGLFDDRTSGSGYSPYTSYTFVTGDTWQEVTEVMTAAMDSDIAEFILSVQQTVAPEHLVVDDVTITAGGVVEPPVDATIQEIQETTNPDGNSPMVGETVNTTGVVTGIITGSNSGFFIQNGTGPWSGIFVFNDPGSLVIGDAVSLSGIVVEFNGQTQLTGVTNLTTTSTGNMLMGTVITTQAGNTEPYESVLVTVENANVLASGPFGQYTVDDGSGTVLVDDVFFAYPFVIGSSYNITGVLQYAFNEWRILPRNNADVELYTGIDEEHFRSTAVFPNPANDLLTIDLSGLNGTTEYQLTDATGRMIATDVTANERVMLETGSLSKGMYMITLRNAGSVWSTRVVVAH